MKFYQKYLADNKNAFPLKDYPTDNSNMGKSEAKNKVKEDTELIAKLQYRLYAENRQSLLIIFQAMDAAGKDSAIRHIMSGINPQGCDVHNFTEPSTEELSHDFMWRHYRKLPRSGKIAIFNRSHYENVLVTRVHPELLLKERIPGVTKVADVEEDFWEERYTRIRNFENSILQSGTRIIKFFLHISREEQRKRFLARIENEEKNWKFSHRDIEEREYWDDYQRAYGQAIRNTHTPEAPWYIIPADYKWYSRVVMGDVIASTLQEMDPQIPKLSAAAQAKLITAKEELEKQAKE